MAAPGLKAIAERLIADDETLEHLVDDRDSLLLAPAAARRAARPVRQDQAAVACTRTTSQGGKVVFFARRAADHIRAAKFTESRSKRACTSAHVHDRRDPDDHDAYPDPESRLRGCIRTLDRFGTNWNPDAARDARPRRQTAAGAGIDEADADDDGEDGGDEE
jgi:hypothetical protein